MFADAFAKGTLYGDSIVDGAFGKSGNVSASIMETIKNSILSSVDALVDDAVSNGITDGNTIGDSAKTYGITDSEELFSLVFPNIDSLVRNVINQHNQNSITQADSSLSNAKSSVDTNIDFDTIVDDILSKAKANANEIISIAANTALSQGTETIVSNLRNQFENRRLKTHMRSVGRFSASLADMNAVIGNSAFVQGLAMLESDFIDSIDMFDAELSASLINSIYPTIFNGFVQSYTNQFNVHLESYIRTILQHVNNINMLNNIGTSLTSNIAGLKEMIQRSSMDRRTGDIMQNVGLRNQSYNSGLAQGSAAAVDIGRVDSATKDGLLKSSATLQSDMVGKEVGLTDSVMKAQTSAQISVDNLVRQLKNQYYLQSVAHLAQLYNMEIDADYKVLSSRVEIDRMKIVAFSEQYVQDLQIDVGDARWDLEAFQYASNVLGSYHGGVVTNPSSITKTQSVLGGALSGASLGASTGNPILMGVGAAVGAGLGAFNLG
jgi:hypothetical protein